MAAIQATGESQLGLEWNDGFLLGFDPLDETHKDFVDLVGRMQAAEDAELFSLMVRFSSHLEAHFEMENRWMNETDFPARHCHIDEHAAVMKSVKEVCALLEQDNYPVGRSIVAELANWFPSHADHLDSALAHWMCKRRFGGKPVVVRRDLTLR